MALWSFCAKQQKIEQKPYTIRLLIKIYLVHIKKKNLNKLLKLLEGVTVRFGGDEKTGTGQNEAVLSAVTGVFEINEQDLSGEDIISNASLALNHAKTVSKKPVAFLTKEMRDSIDEKRLFEIRLPKALANHEFIAYYQPKVDLKTRTICGS